MRMCCGCNNRFEQHRLIRLQTSPETQALIPVVKKQMGRSAWVCCDVECIRKIRKSPKRLQRSLRIQPRMDNFIETLYDWMRTRLRHQLHTMHRDGAVTLSTRNNDIHRALHNTSYIFPTELNMELRLDFWSDSSLATDNDCIHLYKHHLLRSTIGYTVVLMALKLDSIV
jgi:hypothetical protein